MPILYLIPNILSEDSRGGVLPPEIKKVCTETTFFIVENVRTARRFLKKVDKGIDIDRLTFFELNKRTTEAEKLAAIGPFLRGENIGVISEAGCPGVADPGADIVGLAHKKGIQVVPLVGPSSILLALMASGMNGQNFAFNGYLPVKPHDRIKAISKLEKKVKATGQTQLFIETPYRNNQLIADVLKTCAPTTLLCIAANLTGKNEFVATKTIAGWKKEVFDLHKQPAIFLIGR